MRPILPDDVIFQLMAELLKKVILEEFNLLSTLLNYPTMTQYVRFYFLDSPDLWSSDDAKRLFKCVVDSLDGGKRLKSSSMGVTSFLNALLSLSIPRQTFVTNFEEDGIIVTTMIDSLLLKIEMKNFCSGSVNSMPKSCN